MQSIPLPKSISEEQVDANRSIFTIGPLYPGYGTTVGNALRRVLLSSLEGAAITAVAIEGASHEFSTIDYVKEDVVDILLNLKQVRLKVHGEGPWSAKLSVTGEKTVKAGDFETTSDVEVINKKQPIATLTDAAGKLEIEITIGRGRGFVPVETREKEKLPIGTIAVDSMYTPVKNVNFTTEHVRVEQITNFDKLKLDITTDGTIKAGDALKQAGQILVEHFQFVLQDPSETADETPAAEAVDEPNAESAEMPADEAATDEDGKPKKKTTRKKKTDE